MKTAVYSDVHGNLVALLAFIADSRARGASGYICLGDVVGYMPNPSECIETVKNLGGVIVQGNHEFSCSKTFRSVDDVVKDDFRIHNYAAPSIFLTSLMLSEQEKDFLCSRPFVHQEGNARYVHANAVYPVTFEYIILRNAMQNFTAMQEQLLFVGHTHLPLVLRLKKSNGIPILCKSRDVEVCGRFVMHIDADTAFASEGETYHLDDEFRYIINVGSVGVPRDGDVRGSYAIFDDTARTVELVRFAYDSEKAGICVRDFSFTHRAEEHKKFDGMKFPEYIARALLRMQGSQPRIS